MVDTAKPDTKMFIAGLISPFFVVVAAFMLFPFTMFGAWCDMYTWNWFAAPYFHLPMMPFWVSLGIGLWMRAHTFHSKVVKGEETFFWRGILLAASIHGTLLLTAFLVHVYAPIH